MSWPEATVLCVFIVSFAACFIASMFAPPLDDDPFWDEEEDDDENKATTAMTRREFSIARGDDG